MPRPIIGIGHSMGGNNLVNLSLMHPRLLETLVLIDPVMSRTPSRTGNWGVAAASFVRRDRWPSRKVAEESFKRSKFYQAWDPRVLDRWIKYGLRDLPTMLYPDAQPSPAATGSTVTPDPTEVPNVSADYNEKEVTLTTTKHQEVFSFMRTFHPAGPGDPPDKVLHPELPMFEGMESPAPFYRPEPIITFHMLPFLRPTVLYVFGEFSDLSTPEARNDKMTITGTGVGGSGGAKAGKVVEVLIKDTGHLIAMEKVEETATLTADWVGKRTTEWRQNEAALQKYWDNVPDKEKYTLSAEFGKGFKTLGLTRPPRPAKPNGSKL
jgi:pimeloyl-ACP methyl ester carboxylesterase